MRRSKSRSSSLDFPDASSADFSSQPCIVYTDRQTPIPLLITPPRSICALNLAGTAMRPFASIVCSCSPRNITDPVAGTFFNHLETSCSGGPREASLNILPYSGMLHSLLYKNHTNSPLFPTFPHSDYNR